MRLLHPVIYKPTHARTHVCTCTVFRSHAHTRANTHTHTNTNTHTLTNSHTHTHTHTHIQAMKPLSPWFQTSLSPPFELAKARHDSVDNTLQHTATHCNALQHTATHCNISLPHSQLWSKQDKTPLTAKAKSKYIWGAETEDVLSHTFKKRGIKTRFLLRHDSCPCNGQRDTGVSIVSASKRRRVGLQP